MDGDEKQDMENENESQKKSKVQIGKEYCCKGETERSIAGKKKK